MLSLTAAIVLASPEASWLETTWTTTPACVRDDAVPQLVERLIGQERALPATRVELGARDEAGAWTVELALQAGDITAARTLHGDDCEVITEAVALVLAVQLDPVAVAATVQPTVAPTAVPDATIEPAPPELAAAPPSTREPTIDRPSPRPLPRVPTRPRAVLGAEIAGELGVFPRGAATFELGVGVTWRYARAELAGLTSIGPDAPRVDGVTGRFRLFAGVVRGCGVIPRDTIEFPICAALEVGELWAKGRGLERPDTVHALWLAPVVGFRPRWLPTPRLALGAIIDVVIPIYQHRFTAAGFAHAVAPVGGRVGLGIEVRLP